MLQERYIDVNSFFGAPRLSRTVQKTLRRRQAESLGGGVIWYPHQDSNLELKFRKLEKYPYNGDKYYLLLYTNHIMLLNEIFDSNTNIRVSSSTADVITMDFNVGDMEFSFTGINETGDEDPPESWSVEFGLRRGGAVEHNLTQTGKAFQVLGAVQQCVIKMLTMRSTIGRIVFTAEKSEGSRVKLYDRLLRSLKIPGWTSDKVDGGWRNFYIFVKT